MTEVLPNLPQKNPAPFPNPVGKSLFPVLAYGKTSTLHLPGKKTAKINFRKTGKKNPKPKYHLPLKSAGESITIFPTMKNVPCN